VFAQPTIRQLRGDGASVLKERLAISIALGVVLAALVPAGGAGAPASAQAGSPRLHGFRTPTGNIVCLYYKPSLRCDIGSGLSLQPSRPAGCPRWSDFGQGLWVATGRAHVVCAGDTTLGGVSPRVLAYGRIWRRNAITCRSRSTGVTCRNTAGHGFFLSRESWRVF
jgi:hypothetical protein